MRAGPRCGLIHIMHAIEKVMWSLAVSLTGLGAVIGGSDWRQHSVRLAAFDEALAAAPEAGSERQVEPPLPGDRSDWSTKRVADWSEARADADNADVPQAVLRIPELGIEAEVFAGTGDRVLDLGLGHIEGTAGLNQSGNVGIAGHRDGYFRRLKDARPNQRIEILTRTGRRQYVIVGTHIVEPTNTSVLAGDGRADLTLVTCYPFYFLGSAPQRFIVHARRVDDPERT